MNKSTLFGAVLMMAIAGHVGAADNLEMEPCINGEVSASGLFASQAEEDAYNAEAQEPCIHGELADD